MSIKDYSKCFDKSQNTSNHAPFFPKNIFCIIAGSTGCGKTNLLLNFLLQDGYLDYGSLYVYCSTLHQPAYQYLTKMLNKLESDIKEKYNINIKIGHFFEDDEEGASNIIDPKELDPKISHIMVFDDVMLSDQTKIKEYFCKGRHNNVNIFYLCQSLHKIAKHCIRENANIFILFHQDDKTLQYFYETHISGDMDFKEFKTFCDNAWSRKHGFTVINIWEEPYCGRYIANYDQIYTPLKYKKIQEIHKNT
jgi:hypothetical protein